MQWLPETSKFNVLDLSLGNSDRGVGFVVPFELRPLWTNFDGPANSSARYPKLDLIGRAVKVLFQKSEVKIS